MAQASGLSSWSTSASAPISTKSTVPGVWSSSGYQKKDMRDTEPPRYTSSTGQSPHGLGRPLAQFSQSRRRWTASFGLGVTYNPNALRETMGPPPPTARSGVGAPSYDESHRRMGNYPMPHHVSQTDVATTTIGKKPKCSGKWDRPRWKSGNVDIWTNPWRRPWPTTMNRAQGRMSSSPVTTTGARIMEQAAATREGTPPCVADRRRALSPEQLERFVDLAQTLDAPIIGDLLLDKLEDDEWKVAFKALHVVQALLDSPGDAPYHDIFLDHVHVIQAVRFRGILRKNAKTSVGAKALQVLRALGEEEDDDDASATRKQQLQATQGQPAVRREPRPCGSARL
ncbi:hypothetical protein PsorP6_012590 [Peronosclerospora sorghi]|uniref:Uncharacterized protein n=1 Tax=Peronosclerospora sorghi TaxID=230839 RepID=A0ACC0WIH2_9STRA|nr:hypothetical protein PsorP6_012590 [Peronosclerospora sorghi]